MMGRRENGAKKKEDREERGWGREAPIPSAFPIALLSASSSLTATAEKTIYTSSSSRKNDITRTKRI